jgi:hypothetical protein
MGERGYQTRGKRTNGGVVFFVGIGDFKRIQSVETEGEGSDFERSCKWRFIVLEEAMMVAFWGCAFPIVPGGRIGFPSDVSLR